VPKTGYNSQMTGREKKGENTLWISRTSEMLPPSSSPLFPAPARCASVNLPSGLNWTLTRTKPENTRACPHSPA